MPRLLFRSPRALWLALALLAASACKTNAPDPATATAAPAPNAPVLTGSTLLTQVSVADLAGRVPGVPLAATLARYPLRVYRLTYHTHDTDGQ